MDIATDFPEPVLEPLPYTVGVRFPAELADFVHKEDPLMDAEWTISLGEANIEMFRTLFAAMFAQAIELDPKETGKPAAGIDLIIEPRLEELEFTVPRQSGNDQYTVWLRYDLKLLLGDGTPIGDWRITAYGQEDEGSMGMGAEAAMRDAAITALRDAAASIVIGFAKAPGIETYLLNDAQAQPKG